VTITIKVTLIKQEEEEEEEEEEVWHYSEMCHNYGYVGTLKFLRLCPLVLSVSGLEVRQDVGK
jgi:hypothetical protein